jgi:uncharacterized protein YjbJ (UPF0337 family)
MNSSTFQGNWSELKGKIKTQWAKFNDDDLETLKGNLDQLSGKIQKVYGYGKEQAEREYNEFKQKLNVKTNDATHAGIVKANDAVTASNDKVDSIGRKLKS